MPVTLNVNKLVDVVDADPSTLLLYVLRDDMGLYGAKYGCGLEQCGACLVLVDGAPTCSCACTLAQVDGKAIETVEGLAGADGASHPLQTAFLELNAAQCGYCTAGILMRAKALLRDNDSPTRTEICAALDGHLCRCGAHPRIIKAVERAAAKLRVEGLAAGKLGAGL